MNIQVLLQGWKVQKFKFLGWSKQEQNRFTYLNLLDFSNLVFTLFFIMLKLLEGKDLFCSLLLS